MGLSATLAGKLATRARVAIPAWGIWYADVGLDSEVALSGRADLVVNDLTLKGTILSGGPEHGRSSYFVVGGAGGWGKTIAKKSYANDAGVRLATVVGDAAQEAGETLDATTIDRTMTVGPFWTRDEDQASRVLQSTSPSAWYVDVDGVTRIGRRAQTKFAGQATRVAPVDQAHKRLELAADTIAALVPGVVVDGLEALDVEHTVNEGKLRTTLYGRDATSSRSQMLDSFRAIFDQLDPDRLYRGTYEYRVVTLTGNRVNLQPVLVSTGMPDLQRVFVRPGVSGAKSTLALGSRVLVTWVNADRGRPAIVACEDPDGDGFVPVSTSIDAQTLVSLAGGADFVALAARVSSELSSIATALTTHTHAGVTAGTAVTGVAASSYTPGSVAASKVKAT